MSDSNSIKLSELLRLAKERPLTEAEREMLQKLLATSKDSAAESTAAIEHHLEANYIASGRMRSWSKGELSGIAAAIDQKTTQRSTRYRFGSGVQRLAWGMAIFVALIGIVYIWALNSQPEIEPAIQFETEPTQTPIPTPTLQPSFQYADLQSAPVTESEQLEVDEYTLTLSQVEALWADDIYLPQQMPESWSFLGAAINTSDVAQEVLEVAFIQNTAGSEELWILSQAPAEGVQTDEPLPVIYQPLERVDEINDYEDKEVEVGATSGRGYQYEFVDRTGPLDWIVYNTVTWQQDDQLLNLTFMSEGNFPTTIVALTAEKLDVQVTSPE